MEPLDLKRKLEEGNFIAFLGAGYSKKGGYLNWIDLIKKVTTKIDPILEPIVEKQLSAGRYLKAADIVKASVDDDEFYKIVCEVIKETRPSLKSVEAVAYLPFHKVMTTNYDRLYEKSVAMTRGEDVVSFSSGEEEINCFATSKDECVLHLHGDESRPKSVVLDTDSYRRVTETEWYQTCIRSFFLTHPFLFIGFSFKDPAILLFVNFCKKYLKFYLQHRSYALAIKGAFSEEELKSLKESNIEIISFDSYDEMWAFLEATRFEQDSIKLIHQKQQASIPALHILKQKLGVAYAAARLYLDGNIADSQSRIIAAFILNYLLPDRKTSFDDLSGEIEDVFILSKAIASDLTERGLVFLEAQSRASGNKNDGFLRTDQSFDFANFQEGLDRFIDDMIQLFEATYSKRFPGDRARLLEFVIDSIEANCAGLASGGTGTEILNTSSLLDGFLRVDEMSFKKEFEQAIRLGTKNISIESAGVLRKLALAASAFQLSFYNPQKVLGPITSNVDALLVDANVLLPILAIASPEASFNKRVVAQLAKISKPIFVTNGAIQEITAHLSNAMDEYKRCNCDDDAFTSGLHLASRSDTNAFQVAFAVFRERERLRFTQYIEREVGWKTDASLKVKLEQLGFKVLEKNRKKEELERISSLLKEHISPESKKVRIKVLLEHDAEYIYLMQGEKRYGLLTYDAELSRAVRQSKQLNSLHNRIISPIALASFMDFDSLPDIDCKAYIRRLLPTGQGTIEDVVQTHYLSKALMDGHKLSMKDINKIMSVVTDALSDAAKKSAFDIHNLAEIPIERASQIMSYIDPKFIEFAKDLDRNGR